jgi:hypothetical protein
VRTGLHSLHAERVGTAGGRQFRLPGLRDGDPHAAADRLQRGDQIGLGAAEGEAHDGRRIVEQGVDLLGPVVVVPEGLPDGRPDGLGIGREALDVGGERRRVGRRRAGHEDVHPERRLGRSPDFAHLGAHRRRRLVAAGEEAHRSGGRGGDDEPRGRRAARHGSDDEGTAQEVSKRAIAHRTACNPDASST